MSHISHWALAIQPFVPSPCEDPSHLSPAHRSLQSVQLYPEEAINATCWEHSDLPLKRFRSTSALGRGNAVGWYCTSCGTLQSSYVAHRHRLRPPGVTRLQPELLRYRSLRTSVCFVRCNVDPELSGPHFVTETAEDAFLDFLHTGKQNSYECVEFWSWAPCWWVGEVGGGLVAVRCNAEWYSTGI